MKWLLAGIEATAGADALPDLPAASMASYPTGTAGDLTLIPRATHTLQADTGPHHYEFTLDQIADVEIDFLHDRPSIESDTSPAYTDVWAALYQVREGEEDTCIGWATGSPRRGLAYWTGAFRGDDATLGELDQAALSPGRYRIEVNAWEGVTCTYTLAATARTPRLSIERRNGVEWPALTGSYEPGDGVWWGDASSTGAVQFRPTGELDIYLLRGSQWICATRNLDGTWTEEAVAPKPPASMGPFESRAVGPDGTVYTIEVSATKPGAYASKLACKIERNGETTTEQIDAGASNLNIEAISIAIGADGQPAFAVQRVQRVTTGSAQNSRLLYFQRQANGSWTSQTVVTRSNGYTGRDGSQFTGAQPQLLFDVQGRPNIVFTDYASSHFTHAFQSYGQIRHAVRNGSTWTLQTVYSQRDTVNQQMIDPTMAIGPQGELVFVGLAETFIPGPGKKVRFAYTTLEIVSPGAPPVLPTLSIAGTSATEGAAAVFTVNLSSAGNQAVTVNYATAHGTAGSKDYRGTNKGKLTIPAGHSSGTIRIATAGDKLDEDDETFLLTLTGANGAQLPEGGAATVTGTIVDDDLPPVLSVADARATETSSGNAAAVFAVRLSAASGKPITLDWATADGTAKAGSDYAALADSLRFEPGEKSKKISVPILDDLLDEADETFRLELSNAVNATPGRTAATGTVRDNDPPPKLSITDTSIAEEGGAAVFTVTLSAVSGRTVSVNYATADGTAKAGLDYTATNGTLIFEPGVVSQTILVPILDDQLSEVNETLKMNLSRAVGASLQRGKATATIVDDEPKQVSSLQSSWSADFSIASGLPRRTAGTTTWLKSRLAAAQDEALWQIMLAHGREEDRKSF